MISARREVDATPFAEHGGRLALAHADGAGPARHDFSVCLNAFGPAEVVSRAIAECRIDEYPDPRSHRVRHAAAERWRRPASEVVFAAGAAELIHAVCFAYLQRGDHALIGAPAFGEYARAISLCGATPRTIGLLDDPRAIERLAAEIARTRPRLTFLTTPASPTGDMFNVDDLRTVADVARANDCLLVLDQAYDAFALTPLGTPALAGHDAVLHLRSMTKDHALAGVRVAFGVAAPGVAESLERVRVPWAASTAAQAAGLAALTESAAAHVARTTAVLRSEATRIASALTTRGVTVRPSATHFFLIRSASARTTRGRLLTEFGLLVRDCTSFGLPEWIRVAARTRAENDILIACLESVLT